MSKNKRQHLINGEIRFSEVRVTDEGIMTIQEANRLALSRDMDLVLINDKAQPPVCKILNYEKFIYEQNKKGKNKTLELKEIKLGPHTSDNDVDYRIKHAIEFLNKGHKIKLTMQFRGREMTHIDLGKAVMLKLIAAVMEHGAVESLPSMEGKKLISFIKPKVKK